MTRAEAHTHPGKYSERYLKYALNTLQSYNGIEPFHLFLKKYFSANKKHGSRDRRMIGSLCYSYFRLGKGVSEKFDMKERLLLAAFLVAERPQEMQPIFRPSWNEAIALPLDEKIKETPGFTIDAVFPFPDELSEEIDNLAFNRSFLAQPKVFVRIRPGKESSVLKKLTDAAIPFERMSNYCLAFSNSEKISDVIALDRDAVVQDYSSQRTGEFFPDWNKKSGRGIAVWDCCAASGGKSILACDMLPVTSLTVTDIRKNILENLKERFRKAGLKNYRAVVSDASKVQNKILPETFELVIADVPCSGSGTWARTPEQLLFFQKEKIQSYASTQRNIVSNAVKSVVSGGYLLYITCSVFRKENEENIAWIKNTFPLTPVRQGYLKGYESRADTLFAALLQKESQ